MTQHRIGADNMTIGFIGLGVMGEPMCRNLVTKTDAPVLVFDLRSDVVQRLVGDGAVAAHSIADIARDADLILLSLPGGEQLEAVVAGPDGILSVLAESGGAGKQIVDHTTAPLALTRDLAAKCRAAGAEYCDAPIARTRQAAQDGTLSIMVGGTPAAFSAIEPTLAHMATDITHCGGAGAGQLTKLLNNMMLFQNVRAIAEAHAIATGLSEQLGPDLDLDLETLFGVIAEASGGSFALKNHGMKSILADSYPEQAFSTEYAMKDLSYALDLAEQAGVTAVGAATTAELLSATHDAGHRSEYFPVLRRML